MIEPLRVATPTYRIPGVRDSSGEMIALTRSNSFHSVFEEEKELE